MSDDTDLTFHINQTKYFKYKKCEIIPYTPDKQYYECVLSRDIKFDGVDTNYASVTFHDDNKCIKDAVLDLIILNEPNHLIGWIDDDVVLDFYF